MEPLVVPPCPNWYETKIAVCAPDNTLIYGANNAIVIIKPAPFDQPADITVKCYAHMDRVIALALAPTWNVQHNMLASVGDDRLVKVWNLIDNSCPYSHKAHTTSKSRAVGVAFINDTKVLSVSQDGFIIVWKMTTNEFTPHKNLLGLRAHITAMSTCPHGGWLAAFGMKNGLVIVTDLKGQGKVLYKLRAHEREVLDFAWCPSPTNVLPDKVREKAKKSDDNGDTNGREGAQTGAETDEHQTENETEDAQDTIDAMPANGTHIQCAIEAQTQHFETIPEGVDIPPQSHDIPPQESYDIPPQVSIDIPPEPSSSTQTEKQIAQETLHLVEEAGVSLSLEAQLKPKPKKNPWVGLKHADDDEIMEEAPKPEETPQKPEPLDFLSECLALKSKLTELKDDDELSDEPHIPDGTGDHARKPRKVLQAMRTPKKVTIDIISPDVTPQQMASTDVVSDIPSDETTDVAESRNPTPEPPKPEFLLASSARGGHVVIWRAGTDGRVQRRMRMPRSHNKNSFAGRSLNNLWMTIHWISPEKMLTSGLNGEMLVWDVVEQKPTPKLVHNDHPKQLFCITSPYCHEKENFSKWEDLAAWSIGQDRSIFYTTLHTRTVLASYPTFSCTVQVTAASPIAPTRVALGLIDGMIRFWDLSKPTNQFIQMNQIKMKVGGKIMSLAWHTSHEYLLAFGTEDGQVGSVNAGQCKKPAAYFIQHFLTPIHQLEWAPVPNKSNHGLYCCAGGTIVVYDMENTLANPVPIPTPRGESITHFAWKADYTKLAVGCKNGTVFVLDATYNVKTTLYYIKKAIVSMVWHPMQTAEDEDKSPHEDWLTCGTNGENPVVIFDLAKATDNFKLKEVLAGELRGHVKPVNHVFWSPHRNGIAVTVSEDGTAIVWKDMKPIATFLNNNAEPVVSGMWSPVNENMIITSGRDCTVRVWNLLEHPVKEQSNLMGSRHARRHYIHHKTHKHESEVVKASKSKKNSLFGDLSIRQTNLETALMDCRLMLDLSKEKKSEDVEENSVVHLFGDYNGIVDVINAQKELHKTKGKVAMSHHLSMWTGDIGDAIKTAITNGTLTPILLSVAPMISFKLWQEAVEAYCVQLADSATSDPLEIASYYLALHKVDEAIDILSAKQMFRDALVLAKLKKPNDVDLHKQIVGEWAKACVISGCYEVAAQSYISLGQFEEAARVLYKRTDLESLTLAVELARHAENDALADTIQYRYDAIQGLKENNVELPTRMALELEFAKMNADKNLSTGDETDNIDKKSVQHKDKNVENGNGEIQNVASKEDEEHIAECDNKEVDPAVDNNEHVVVGVKSDDGGGDVPDKNKNIEDTALESKDSPNVVDTDSGDNVHTVN